VGTVGSTIGGAVGRTIGNAPVAEPTRRLGPPVGTKPPETIGSIVYDRGTRTFVNGNSRAAVAPGALPPIRGNRAELPGAPPTMARPATPPQQVQIDRMPSHRAPPQQLPVMGSPVSGLNPPVGAGTSFPPRRVLPPPSTIVPPSPAPAPQVRTLPGPSAPATPAAPSAPRTSSAPAATSAPTSSPGPATQPSGYGPRSGAGLPARH